MINPGDLVQGSSRRGSVWMEPIPSGGYGSNEGACTLDGIGMVLAVTGEASFSGEWAYVMGQNDFQGWVFGWVKTLALENV